MKSSATRKLLGIVVLGLLIVLGVSADAMAQGRGRGLGKKCEKFVNCHDARNGRWDGRGPRRNTSLSERFFRRSRRHHQRRHDYDRRQWRRYRNNRFRR